MHTYICSLKIQYSTVGRYIYVREFQKVLDTYIKKKKKKKLQHSTLDEFLLCMSVIIV